MNMTEFEGYRYVDGGVCAAQGFQANGLNCGLNPDKNKNDLGMVFSKEPCETAAVYTQNKVKGAPIRVTKKHLADEILSGEMGGLSALTKDELMALE